MDPDEIVGGFFAGLVISALTNALFPHIWSTAVENSASFPLLTRVVFLLIPLIILLVVVLLVFESTESFIAGVAGVLFSVFILKDAGISEFVIGVAIIGYAAYKIRKTRE